MPFIAPPITLDDIFRVVWFGRLAGQRILWVLHCRCSDNTEPVYATAMQSLAEELAVDMIAPAGKFGSIATEQSNEFEWEFVRVQRIFPTREVYSQSTVNRIGSDIGEASPPNVCMSTTLRTTVLAPHGVGRVQLAGLPISELNDGLWSDTLVGDIDVKMAAALIPTFVDPTTTNEFNFGVLAQFSVTSELNDITDVVSHNTVRTMHRRTVGLGE